MQYPTFIKNYMVIDCETSYTIYTKDYFIIPCLKFLQTLLSTILMLLMNR